MGSWTKNPFISKGAILNIKLDISGICSTVILHDMLSFYLITKVSGPWDHWNLWIFGIRSCFIHEVEAGLWWSVLTLSRLAQRDYMCYSLSKINGVPKPLLNNTSVKGFGTGLFLVLRCHDDVMATSPLVKTCQVNWRSLRFLVNGHVLAQRTTVSSSLSRRGVRLCWGTRWSGG